MGVSVGTGVSVGVSVGVDVGVSVGVKVGVGVGVGVKVGVGVNVAVGVGVRVSFCRLTCKIAIGLLLPPMPEAASASEKDVAPNQARIARKTSSRPADPGSTQAEAGLRRKTRLDEGIDLATMGRLGRLSGPISRTRWMAQCMPWRATLLFGLISRARLRYDTLACGLATAASQSHGSSRSGAKEAAISAQWRASRRSPRRKACFAFSTA
ncbi:MAG: hypothetical protein EHM70_01165 [Chloroflexota bacterium]|nr:MAG: hypothetical protein EHM70_01165 [Chloroflexota bacterium]